MNYYCESILYQIYLALSTTKEMLQSLTDEDLTLRPTPNKYSVGELFEHIAIICKADLLIADGATEEEMRQLYSSCDLDNKKDIVVALVENYNLLRNEYMNYSETDLQEKLTAYWGVTYTRYEWLLEILTHVIHHRGQLHAMLIHCININLHVSLFE
ncbi:MULTISPECIES: DinB family protein [Bacillus]|uniref:DinB family protein n=1 Tax=Bacillus TaxID=1386 RepID=UPI0002F994F6|nr:MULTISPECIES: DinB family protein [Bacillus]